MCCFSGLMKAGAGTGVGVISTMSGAFVRCPGHGHKELVGCFIVNKIHGFIPHCGSSPMQRSDERSLHENSGLDH